MSFWTMPLPGLMRSANTLPVEFINLSYKAGPNQATGAIVDKPSGTLEGDLMLAWVVAGGGTFDIIDVPTGWTLAYRYGTGDSSPALYYKFATASEPANYMFKTDFVPASGVILTYRNASGFIYSPFTHGSVTNVSTAPSITLTKKSIVIALFCVLNGGLNMSSGPSDMARILYETINNPGVAVYQKLDVPPGSTGDKSVTWSANNSRIATQVGVY